MARQISSKGLKKQLATWEKRDPVNYQGIKDMASHYGLLTKTGKVSISKRNAKKLERFTSAYQEQFGSYSSNVEKRRERYNKYKAKHPESTIKNSKQFEKIEKEIKPKWEEYRKYYDKDNPMSVDEFSLANSMGINEQMDYINDMIEFHESGGYDNIESQEYLDDIFSKGK